MIFLNLKHLWQIRCTGFQQPPVKGVCKNASVCVITCKPAEKLSTSMKDQTEDPESSSSQHGAGVRRHLDAGLVVVCAAV